MKKQNICMTIICVALFLAVNMERIYASIWLLTLLMLMMTIFWGNERQYWEIIEDYPVDDCVKDSCYSCLFKIKKHAYKEIPIEMYYSTKFIVLGFIIYSILGLVFVFFDKKISCMMGGVYVLIAYGVHICGYLRMSKKAFLARFKKLNRYNVKYIFGVLDEPYPQKKGKCKIVAQYSKKGEKYVTVKMMDSNEIIENVLFPGNIRKGVDSVYTFYEICKVSYIV